MSRRECTELGPFCPVEITTYGYLPNLGGNIFFCICFAICLFLQLFFGIRYKTWTWFGAAVAALILETVGYGGRIWMYYNPFADGFRIQIVCLILAPSLLSACVDLTLKHIVIVFGPQLSMIRPALYTWVFIGLDFFSILVQAAGGAIAASATVSRANANLSLLDTGNNLIVAGIVLQVVQLIAFGIVSLLYYLRVKKDARMNGYSIAGQRYLAEKKFRWFLIAIIVAFFAILIRCIYRIPEMATGWGSEIQRDEPSFLVLDGAMVLTAAIALTAFHPGYCFDQLAKGGKTQDVEQRQVTEEQQRQSPEPKPVKA